MELSGYVALAQVRNERIAQDIKWGQQNHPDGTNLRFEERANAARVMADIAADEGNLTWADILLEEVYEALAETDNADLRAELIQVAAVCVAWVEAIDRRANAA
jgi:hypothetical protein